MSVGADGGQRAALRCTDVVVEVDGRRLLDGVSCSVEPGEWLGIIGPNGAGKTTLLRAIAGLVRFGGEIEIGGRASSRLRARDRARLVALVPQSPVVPPGLAVLDYVLLGRTPHISFFASEGAADLDRAWDALGALDLRDLAGRAVESLSGGERQRVLVARALAQSAPVVLLDEPTTALDIGHQQDVLDLVDALRRERSLTVVSTMHDLTLAGQYPDRLSLLRDGAVVHEGAAHEVLTAGVLSRHYGARVAVVDGPHGPIVVPQRTLLEEIR
ncbi:MAG: cobalamin/Fe3+-siderophore ABC transporter ATP-binding protein [Acidimicrobiia bacterium]|nr:MAG: cobalamin/Fe3+-siderophore ABC transporter ATP-binding protein [Acidimicrobiia bacterium]